MNIRKIVKRIIWVLAILISTYWLISAVLLVSNSIQILEPEEQQKLKAGKQFWEWRSPFGPLAMHYVEKGEGPNHLLLIHGFRSHSFTWNALMDPLAEAGYHVWAIDLVGYGLSDKPDHAAYNLDFFVHQIQDFMKAKGIDKAHFLGSSMGGGLALSTAISHPESVQSLILLSPLGYPLDLPLYLSLGRYAKHIWSPFLGPALIRYGLERIVYDKERITDEQIEAYILPYRFPGGVSSSITTLQKFDNQQLVEMSENYPQLKVPALVIWGDHDALIPMTHFEKFAKDFPHADMLLIHNCGHIPQEEEPDQVIAATLEFLGKEKK